MNDKTEPLSMVNLTWKQPTKFYVESEDGKYRVSKNYVRGTAKYAPYFGQLLLGHASDNLSDAKRRCEQHNERRNK